MGIHDTRRRFNKDPLFKPVKDLFKKLSDILRAPPRTAAGAVNIGPVRVEGTGTLSAKLTSVGPTTEERLKLLEDEVRTLREQQQTDRGEFRKGIREALTKIGEEASTRREDDEAIRSLLKDQAAGGLHMEVMGLIWIAVGTWAGSMAPDYIGRFYACIHYVN